MSKVDEVLDSISYKNVQVEKVLVKIQEILRILINRIIIPPIN